MRWPGSNGIMNKQQINIELIQPEVNSLTVKKVAHDLHSQANYILLNSQVIQDIWKDAIRILQKIQKDKPENPIILNGLSLKEVKRIVPKMLDANIVGSERVSEIANLIKLTGTYKEHFESET